MPSLRCEVAIIGGGFSGIACALALHQQQKASDPVPRIVIVDPNASLPAGKAFAGARAEHLLNVRASQMSLFAGQPNDFCEFWAQDTQTAQPDAFSELFAPRALYARYIAKRLRQAQESGAQIEHCRAQVNSAKQVNDGADRHWQIECDALQLHARYMILATGARQSDGLLQHPRVFQGPWSMRSLPADACHDLALVVGGGLSAIDALQTLQSLQWRGKIVLVTPRAVLSEIHVDAHVATWNLPADLLAHCATPLSTLRAFRAQLRLAELQKADWRSVVNALRPITTPIFQNWTPAQRGQFLRHLASVWNRHRHRAPPSIKAFIASLLASEKLRIQAGRVQKLVADDDSVQAEICSAGQMQTLRCNFVIDARGLSYRTAPLMHQLADAGLLSLSETGFGIVSDAVGQVGDALFALGATCFGERLESTAVPELRAQALAIAQQIAKERQF